MTKPFSLLRRLQYQKLSRLILTGRILDVGGAKESGYHMLIGGDHTIDVANIQKAEGVDMIFDAEQTFPIENGTYDGVILLNVLEHLFGYQLCVHECFRILKSGGVVVGSTPFLFNIHGSPNDYFRYTESALREIFTRAGFQEIEITELGTGACAVTGHLFDVLCRFSFIKEVALQVSIFFDKTIAFIFTTLQKENPLSEKRMPLGYFFTAKKP